MGRTGMGLRRVRPAFGGKGPAFRIPRAIMVRVETGRPGQTKGHPRSREYRAGGDTVSWAVVRLLY